MDEALKARLLRTCAWCTQSISPDDDVYGFGARAAPGLDLSDKEGEFVSLQLGLQEKTVFALVATGTSPARAEGFDLVFITCSNTCAKELKDALEFEKEVFE